MYGSSSANLTQLAPKAAVLCVKYRVMTAIGPLKVTQGHSRSLIMVPSYSTNLHPVSHCLRVIATYWSN